MTIFAYVGSFHQNNAATLTVDTQISFVKDGTTYNFPHSFSTIPVPDVLTALLINQNVRNAISDYVDLGYSTSTTGLDVILIGGGVTTPLL